MWLRSPIWTGRERWHSAFGRISKCPMFLLTYLKSPQRQVPIDITQTETGSWESQANYKGKTSAFNKKLKVWIWASRNRDKYMHFSAALKNNWEHNSNVTSNYSLLVLEEANVLLINRQLEHYLFPSISLGGQGRPSWNLWQEKWFTDLVWLTELVMKRDFTL